MSDDYDLDDTPCPKCGRSPTHYRTCQELGCNDGRINQYEEDPLWYDPDDEDMCMGCAGTGVEVWCPGCGLNIQKYRATHPKAAK